MRLVSVGCGGAEQLRVRLVLLLRLDQSREPLLVGTSESGRVDHGAEGLHQTAHVGHVHLREGCRILGHLALDDRDRPPQGVDGFGQLRFVLLEVGRLGAPDGGRRLEVGLARRDARGELLHLRLGGRGVALQLVDVGAELILLGRGGLDLETSVRCGILAPVRELPEGLLLGLAFLLYLGCQGVQELHDLAQRASARACGARRRQEQREQPQQRGGGLHCDLMRKDKARAAAGWARRLGEGGGRTVGTP
mmetsp:Transcript_55998/g.155941  ORF Transcript_55998/g.155941 Transcript_55998/m.155941 type:complete len:250 (+) Transcript_55998:1562-2311(+)